MAYNLQPRGNTPINFLLLTIWFEIIAILEVAGVEPASEKLQSKLSTRLVDLLISS